LKGISTSVYTLYSTSRKMFQSTEKEAL